jgi:hypothetical protein
MFEDWKRVFGSKLKDRQSVDLRTAELWSIALQQLKITPKEFKTAMQKSITLEWPPTAPADFLALARTAQVSEYPTANDAFNTACQNCGMRGDVKRDWKHGVVYETANRIGWGKLASATEYYFKTFQEIYEQVVSEHRNGADFKVPETHQVEHSHTALQPDSPMSAKVDDFLKQFKRKHGEVV